MINPEQPAFRPITIRSRLGEYPGLTDETVAIFDRFDPRSVRVVRHYILLDEAAKLMHEPWGWRERWYIDLIGLRWPDADTLELEDLYLDVIVEGNGPTYRMIDLEDLADALASGKLAPATVHEPLRRMQRFLDGHLHGGKDFPPAALRLFTVLPLREDKPTLEIRPVESPRDLADTVGIYLDCLRGDYTFLPQEYRDTRSPAEELAECGEWLAAPGGANRIYGAFVNRYLVGYTAVGPNTGEPDGYAGEVAGFFVRPAYRGQSIGLRLLRAGLEHLRALGCANLVIYNYQASESNHYYRRLGGEVVYRTVQSPGGMAQTVDVFGWETLHLLAIIEERLSKYPAQAFVLS